MIRSKYALKPSSQFTFGSGALDVEVFDLGLPLIRSTDSLAHQTIETAMRGEPKRGINENLRPLGGWFDLKGACNYVAMPCAVSDVLQTFFLPGHPRLPTSNTYHRQSTLITECLEEICLTPQIYNRVVTTTMNIIKTTISHKDILTVSETKYYAF